MSNRRGYSLIELLVVVGIIALLASMSLVVMKDILDQSREDATVMTVTKVSELLEERLTAFDRAANAGLVARYAGVIEQDAKQAFNLPFTGTEPRLLRRRVAEIIARKVLYKQNFPQRFAEMADVDDYLAGTGSPNRVPDIIEQEFGEQLLEAARRRLIAAGMSATDPEVQAEAVAAFDFNSPRFIHRGESESSELLYFMLTRMPVFGISPVGGDGFNNGEVADTDGDGLPEFIDAWGNPLRFYRWPTRLIDVDNADTDPVLDGVQGEILAVEREFAKLLIRSLPGQNGITRDPLLVDPDDTIGRIGFELARLSPANDAPDLSTLYNEATFHTPDVYHTPLIISAGEDGEVGLAEPWFVDGDWNGDGMVDTDVDPRFSEDPNGNGTHDAIYGNLASPPDVDGDELITLADLQLAFDAMTDNITNRNRRAGGSN